MYELLVLDKKYLKPSNYGQTNDFRQIKIEIKAKNAIEHWNEL